MSRAPSASADGRQDRRRSSSCARNVLPSRRSSSALDEYPPTAVTRAIYHHARAYLARTTAARTLQERCHRVLHAVRQAAHAVILESTVVQIMLRCVEETKQRQARLADEMWRRLAGDVRILFGGHKGIDSVAKIAQSLADMLAGFDGGDDVRARFLNVAKSFDNSEVALKQLQVSFGDNLDGLYAMRNDFDRFTDEIIRLVSLLEGDCNSMRVQLHRTLKSPRQRVNGNMFGGFETLGRSRMTFEGLNSPAASQDHISTLRSALEHDLCDTPLAAMVQVAQDVNKHIVEQLADRKRDVVSEIPASHISDDITNVLRDEAASPTKILTDMFQALRPCILEAACVDSTSRESSKGNCKAMGQRARKSKDGVGENSQPGHEILVSPSSPMRPPVDVDFARAQLAHSQSSHSSQQSGFQEIPGAFVPCPNPTEAARATDIFAGQQKPQKLPKLKPLQQLDEPEGTRAAGVVSSKSGALTPIQVQQPLKSCEMPGFVTHTHDSDLHPAPELGSVAPSTVRTDPRGPREGKDQKGDDFSAEAVLGHKGLMQLYDGGDTRCYAVTSGENSHSGEFLSGMTGNHNSGRMSAVSSGNTGQVSQQSGERAGFMQPQTSETVRRIANGVQGPKHGEHEQGGHGNRREQRISAQGSGQMVMQTLSSGLRSLSQPNLQEEAGMDCTLQSLSSSSWNMHDSSAMQLQPEQRLPQVSPGRVVQGAPALQRPEMEHDVVEMTHQDRRSASLPLSSDQSLPSKHRAARLLQESADYSRFKAVDRQGYDNSQMSVTPFLGSPLLVRKSKIEERPRRPSLTANASEPLLQKPDSSRRRGLPPAGQMALPPPRQLRSTSSPRLGPLRSRPRSLDTSRDNRSRPDPRLLPNLDMEVQASSSRVFAQQRKASPSPIAPASEEEEELLR
mmetsp:Transcript_62574/g.146823  ORF Transcript_62574/g.146823 Transcript_62574/m.146823 type:complete len:907 (+) Transcript_62574:23-2743(+)